MPQTMISNQPSTKSLLDMNNEEVDGYIATNTGMYDVAGRITQEGMKNRNTLPKSVLEDRGIVEDREGLFTSFGQAVNRTTKQVIAGHARTLGNERLAEEIDTGLEFRRDLDPVKWSDSKLGWFGDSLGMGLTESAGTIAASAVMGPQIGGAVGMGVTYSRLFGDNKKRLQEINTMGLDEGEINANAVMLTAFQAVVEVMPGTEVRAGSALRKMIGTNAGKNGADVLASVIKTSEGKGIIRRMAKEFYKPTNPFTGGVKAATTEFMEEVAQEIGAIEAESKSSGKYPTREEFIQRALIEPLRALPAGFVMGLGAYEHTNQTAKEDADVIPVDDNSVLSIHGVADPETGIIGIEGAESQRTIKEEEGLFSALAGEIMTALGVSEEHAAATADFLRQVAYSNTRLARKHGFSEVMPSDFIDDLKVVGLSETLDAKDIAVIQEIQQKELDPAKRSELIMEYIAGQHGNSSKFYGMLKSIRQASQILTLEGLESELRKRAEVNGAVPLKTDDAKTAFNETIAQAVKKIMGGFKANAFKTLDSGKIVLYEIDQILEGDMTRTEMAQLYMYGAQIQHNGKTYFADIFDGKIRISSEEQGVTQEDVDAQKKRAKERREFLEGPIRREGMPEGEEIQTDDNLAVARANYAFISNKVVGMEDFLEYFDNRHEWSAPASVDYGGNANTVYQHEDGTAITGKPIIDQAIADAEGASVTDVINNQRKFMEYGLEANELYINKVLETLQEQHAEHQNNIEDARVALDQQREAEIKERANETQKVVAIVQEMIKEHEELVEIRRTAEEDGDIEGLATELHKKKEERKQKRVGELVAQARIRAELNRIETAMDENGVAGDPVFRRSAQKLLNSIISAAEAENHQTVKSLTNKLLRRISKRVKQRNRMAAEVRAEIDSRVNMEDDFNSRMEDIAALREAYPDVSLEEANAMLDGTYDGDTDLLLQDDQGTVGGMYKKSGNIAVFFGNADIGTAIHEISHHMFHMLPESAKLEIQGSLSEQFGVKEDIENGVIGVHTEEAFADSINEYIISGKLPTNITQQSRNAYATIRASLGEFTRKTLRERGFELSEQAEAFFDEHLSGVPATKADVAIAEASMDGIISDPPSANQVEQALAENDILMQEGQASTTSLNNQAKMLRQMIHRIIGKATGKTGQSLREDVRQMIREMFPETFGNRDIHEISIKELSLAQLRQVERMVKGGSKTKKKAVLTNSRKAANEIVKEESGRPTAEHPDKAFDKKTDKFLHKILQVVNKAIDFNSERFSNLSFFTRFLDGGRYNGTFSKYILQPIIRGRQEAKRILTNTLEKFDAMKQRYGLPTGGLGTAKNIVIEGRRFSESEIVLLALAGKKVNGQISLAQQAIAESNGVTDAQFAEAIRLVNENEQMSNHMKFLQEAYNEIYEIVAPTYFRVTGKTLPKIENYFPLVRRDTLYARQDDISPLLETVSPAGRDVQSTKMAALESRSMVGGSEIRLDNADLALVSYATAAANYAAKAETVRGISEILNDGKIKDHFVRVYGSSRGATVAKILEKLVAREMFANAKITGMSDGQLVLRDVRNRFTLAMLGGRAMTMAKQSVSIFNYMALMSGALSPRFMMEAAKNAMVLNGVIIKNASINLQRAADGSYQQLGYRHLFEGHRLHNMLKEMAPIIYARHGNPETAEFEEHGFRGVLGIKIKGIPLGTVAMGGITLFDMTTIGTAWLTGYEYIMNKEIEGGTEASEASRIASETVSQMISDSQPPSLPHERTMAQTDSELLKAHFPFSGQTMINWQNWIYGVLTPSVQMIAKGRFGDLFKKDGHYSPVAQRLAFGFMVPAIMLGFLSRRRWPKDKEELVLDMLLYPLSQVPVFGASGAYGLSSGYRGVRFEPIYLKVGNDVMRSMIDIANHLSGRQRFDQKRKDDFIEAASLVISHPPAITKFWQVMIEEYKRDRFESFDHDALRRAISAEIKD
jgi:hypothetical protein